MAAANEVGLLVVDTNALIAGGEFTTRAEKFATVAEVLEEVKDARTKEFVENLKVELKCKAPSKEAMAAVLEAAKRTGDYGVLSIADCKCLALAYDEAKKAECLFPPKAQPDDGPNKKFASIKNGSLELESEIRSLKAGAPPQPSVGDEAKPVVDQPNAQEAKKEGEGEGQGEGEGANPTQPEKKKKKKKQKKNSEWAEISTQKRKKKKKKQDNSPFLLTPSVRSLPAHPNQLPGWEQGGEDEAEPAAQPEAKEGDGEKRVVSRVNMGAEDEASSEGGSDCGFDSDPDAGDWVTPDNLDLWRNKELGFDPVEEEEGKRYAVGIVTSDFPMQNTALQLGIVLVNIDGRRIKGLQKWVFRCHGCFTIVTDTTKQFCPSCGAGDTLKRVSYVVDQEGNMTYYVNYNRQLPVGRAKKHLPKPRGGHNNTNKSVVLCEDQLASCGNYPRRIDLEKRLGVVEDEEWDFAPKRSGKKANHMQRGTSYYRSSKRK